MKTAARALIVAGLVAAPLAAQQPSSPLEVASVKPNRTSTSLPRFQAAPGRYTWTAFTLKSLIDVAFQRNAFDRREIIGGPDWIDKDRFDLVVQAQAGATLSDPDGFPGPVFAMVRAALTERFGLVTHNERRERPVYALTTARADRRLGDGLKRTAAVLGRTVGRPVIDRSGVDGHFNLTVEYTPEAGITGPLPPGVPPPDAPARTDAPSLFTALQEQLGLKLEATRAPVDVLVIDSATQPTEN